MGKLLLKQVESFVKNLGVDGIGLNSGNRPDRTNAQQFYKKMGYTAEST
ncbi:hypothetical protein ACTNDN_08660 [Niallia sp. HCP3S3_B10]